jgi:hypothetical protein
MTENTDGLKLLREPFAAHQISKLPKPTKHQTEMVKKDFKTGIRCGLCGGWHHKDVIHLDYVGHAALTDRLLDSDIGWSWEALSLNEQGLPAMDENRGMWIKLTVCGITRLGYGDAGDKTGGNAIKEVIGDALRNAAMRFGAALDLWHKGDLHDDNAGTNESAPKVEAVDIMPAIKRMTDAQSLNELAKEWTEINKEFKGKNEELGNLLKAKDIRKLKLRGEA